MSSNNYLSDVANLFLRRRGSILSLSPLDWQIIADWQTVGIPLYIVCRAIDDVFDKYDRLPKNKKHPVKSISYCAEEIEIAFDIRLQMQIGR